MPSNRLILCRLLPLSPTIFPSIRVFSNESVLCNRWPKYWSFSFNISLSSEYSGLISLGMDWIYLFAVQGTLKEYSQHHSSKASIFRCSAFFIVHFHSHTWPLEKTIALTRQTFASKIKSLIFNMLCRLVITSLLRSKCFFFHFMAAVAICSDFGALPPPAPPRQKNKVCHCFHFFPIYLP